MILSALAIAPGLAICLYLFYNDVYNREPAANLMASFFLGMACTIPAAVLELLLSYITEPTIGGIIVEAFVYVALVEEAAKLLVLRYYCFRRRSFDEPLDGIVYSVMVSMGFATLENLLYVLWDEDGLSVALMRMFTSVPGHATFAVIMGYYAGKAKYEVAQRNGLFWKALGGATLAHGTYDAFIMLTENNWLQGFVSDLLLFLGALLSLFVSIRLGRSHLRKHRILSQQLFRSAPTLTIRLAATEDIPLIQALAGEVWPQTYEKILNPLQIEYMMERMYSRDALQRQMEESHQFLIVYNAGFPVGYASYGETGRDVYKLHKIYILPGHQGRGAGRFVLQQIIRDITPKGATALQLDVNRQNGARHFYEKLGFGVIRTEDTPIGNDFYMNDYVMEKKLEGAGIALSL